MPNNNSSWLLYVIVLSSWFFHGCGWTPNLPMPHKVKALRLATRCTRSPLKTLRDEATRRRRHGLVANLQADEEGQEAIEGGKTSRAGDAREGEGKGWTDQMRDKTIQALDSIFAGGFMMEGKGSEMLMVLRKWMMSESVKMDKEVEEGRQSDESTDRSIVAKDYKSDSKTLDRSEFSAVVKAAGLEQMEASDIDMVFDGMDANQDGTLSLEEVVETYRRVHAEVVLDGDLKVDEEEMKVAPDNLDRIDLRPAAPGAEVNSILPFYADGSSSASALSHQWKQVCDALAKQSMYLPPDEQYQVQDALRFTGERLLGSRLVDKKFGEGLAIGSIIAGLQLPTPVLVSAVLLPCVRERSASIQEVRDRFGPVVGSMVEDSVWLSQLPDRVGLLDDDGSRFLREYMVAASRDHRAVIVMLADRLNALRKIEEAPLYDQHLKALESLQVFSPLAHALGVGKWLWELEDLSFRALFPDSYTSVEQWQLELWEVSSNMMEQAKVDVLKALNENDFLLEHVERYAITSRRKSVFSTFKKMFRSNKKLEDVKDVFAMRVVIGLKSQFRSDDSVQVRTCTEAYGAVRKALVGWEEPRGRFKDYVTHPKPNGYQSIHTTLDSPLKLPLEVQIRTEEMHAAAEFGDASHNLYKGGIKSLSAVQNFADMVRKSNVAALAPADSDLSEENSEEQRDLDALEFSNEAAEASSLELSLDSSDAIKRKNERSVEGEGTGAGFLDEDELRNMILTAPGVNDDVSMGGSEEEHAWQLDSLGQDLLFVVPAFERSSIEADLRQSSEIVLAASQDAAAAYAAGQETPLKLDRVLADLMAAAEDGSGKETEEFEAQRRFLRQQGIDVIKRQDVLRTMLDSNKARLFDPDEVMAKLLDEWDERLSDERSREPRQDAGGEQPRGKLRCELLEEPAGMFSSMEFERSSST